jgi:Protein of unknown function (DUF3135)
LTCYKKPPNIILRGFFVGIQSMQDFDYWSTLFKSDPQKFESERKLIIDQTIAQSSERNRKQLVELQSKIDNIRSSNSPITATIQLHSLLIQHTTMLGQALTRLNQHLKRIL